MICPARATVKRRLKMRAPFRAAHLPRYLPTRRDAASPWFIRLASHPKETHRPGASRRRGETPHLLESSLIAICDQASNGKEHDETPTVHKTPSLPLRHELRAPQPSASDTKRRSLPWRRGFQPRQICRVAQGGPSRGALRLLRSSRYALTQPDAFGAGASRDGQS